MAAVDFVQAILEENPLFEGAVATPSTGPNRLATEKLYLPARTAKARTMLVWRPGHQSIALEALRAELRRARPRADR